MIPEDFAGARVLAVPALLLGLGGSLGQLWWGIGPVALIPLDRHQPSVLSPTSEVPDPPSSALARSLQPEFTCFASLPARWPAAVAATGSHAVHRPIY